MSPLLLIIGFTVGLVTVRGRTLVLSVLALGVAWGIVIAAGGGLDDLFPAFAVGSANVAAGAIVGAAAHLAGRGLSRSAA